MIFSKKFISATEEMSGLQKCIPSPYIRKKVFLNKAIQKATFTICGLGFYRFWLNGQELTKGFLSPWISNPDDVLDYDCYDVTTQLQNGANVLAFQLGNGMQNAFGGFVWDFEKATFRSPPKMACCLNIRYADGSVEQMEADQSFVWHASPLLRDDLRMGEIYDANCEIDDWQNIDFDDSIWQPTITATTPKGQATLCQGNPIVKVDELKPISITQGEWIPGLTRTHHYGYIYDFGLNTAGTVTLKIKGYKGQKVTLTFAELLHDGKFYTDSVSFVWPDLEMNPDYIQQDVYICKGHGEETYQPSFTYHGFRYVFVEGLMDEQATKDLLTYNVMHTQLEEMGNFVCSCDTLNKLQAMTRNATVSNFWHFPNDCPHREKNGWTADVALSVEHTLLNLNPTNNYKEWLLHVCKAQNEQGALPGIVPTAGWGFKWGNGPAWDQAIVEIPYMVYRYTGDVSIVESCVEYLVKYVCYLHTRLNERGLLEIGLGDWCAVNGIASPLELTDSVITISICQKVAFLLELCNKQQEANFCKQFATSLKNNVREYLIDSNSYLVAGECQTSQAMAIYYDIFTNEEKPQAVKVLLSLLEKQNWHIDTGVLGGRVIFHVLADFGYADLACNIICNPTPPSYGYWIEKGYTALAEDFQTDDREIRSKNHHFWGDISAFFIKDICGIHYNPNMDDLSYVEIKPNFVEKLSFAEAYHVCPQGKISVRWKRVNNGVKLAVNLPDGVKGNVKLPANYTEVSINEQSNGVVVIAQRK